MGCLLEIDNLSVQFYSADGIGRAVDNVSFTIGEAETVGLVGESGCGKSVTALSILGLIDSPPGRIASGRIMFGQQDLLQLGENEMRRIRGHDISMIFQEPMTSLNPLLPIGRQVAEPLMVHRSLGKQAARDRAADWLDQVKIPAARQRLKDYPHQLSGGMRQRVMIAMAMVCGPKLLIADEPTTALDVSIQSQMLSLMDGLKTKLGMSLLLITHDMGVVAQMAHRVVVMYAGQVVEVAEVGKVFDAPFHPYTQGLLNSIPQLGRRRATAGERLNEIPGTVPAMHEALAGCRFADRCPHVITLCREKPPQLVHLSDGHAARCWLAQHLEKAPSHD